MAIILFFLVLYFININSFELLSLNIVLIYYDRKIEKPLQTITLNS